MPRLTSSCQARTTRTISSLQVRRGEDPRAPEEGSLQDNAGSRSVLGQGTV